ncbi:uncharacterized protein LOC143631541 [Bidens hawaiensis]|uniref:uncharacterized protein LOC143631541 n=1 Tax=Bidens hawaiensis TaxID=980011 RepID=UPI00404AE13D
MAPHSFFMCSVILTLSLSFNRSSSYPNYVVINDAPNHGGGIKFAKVIGGIPYTKQIMHEITNFIWSTVFKQNTPADRKPVDTVEAYIAVFDGAKAFTWGNNVNVSEIYLRGLPGANGLEVGIHVPYAP